MRIVLDSNEYILGLDTAAGPSPSSRLLDLGFALSAAPTSPGRPGSATMSWSGWTESEEGVRWVQEELDALWSSPHAMDLAEAVVQDVARLIHRVVIPDIDDWKKEEAKPAEPIVELPIYRRENGLPIGGAKGW